MTDILLGIKGILMSKKGVLSLIIASLTTALAFTQHMNPSVAACFGVVQGIFCWTSHKTDIAAMKIVPQMGQGDHSGQ